MPEVKLNTEAWEAMRKYATARSVTSEEAASKLVIVATNRLNATDKYAKKNAKGGTAKAKPKAPAKAAKPKASKAVAKAAKKAVSKPRKPKVQPDLPQTTEEASPPSFGQ